MDRILLTNYLANAISQVDEGEQEIKRLRERIYRLRQKRRSTRAAKVVLATLIKSQKLRIADRNRLKTLLAA